QALFKQYPLMILGNLTQNTYSFLTYKDFTSTECQVAGTFDELIESGATTMHEMDKNLFKKTFSRENLLKEYEKGSDKVEIRVIQKGDDGQLRRVEITDYFVKDDNSDDVLVVSLNRNM
ncbi:MAG: EAL domain-containing protein, partial [Pseudobutyrivibrio sp.]|nr:EAL domain-containing protein [Pseudobutyrivibrio sp.]